MTYSEFVFSQLSMGKILEHSAILKDEPYDNLYPMIIQWYNEFYKSEIIKDESISLYDAMQKWIDEHVG